MESIYGPRPHQRRGGGKHSEPAPLVRRVIGRLALGASLLLCFVVLFAVLEADSTSDTGLERLQRIQQGLGAPTYHDHAELLRAMQTPAFTPLQTAIILPSSALRPAGADATATPKRYQTAGLIP